MAWSLIFARINAAAEPVDDGVAARAAVEKIYRADDFALGRKINFRRVVRARERVPAHVRAVGFARPDARRETGMDQRAVLLFHFVALAAVTPVEPAIGMEERPVNVRRVARVFEAADDHLASVGHAVAVGVGQLPDAGRRRDVERAVEPDAALREGHLVGEHAGLVVNAIAVGVGEEEHAVGQLPFPAPPC